MSASAASNPLREARARWAAGALLRILRHAVVWVGGGGRPDEQALLRFGRFPERDAAAASTSADGLRALLPAGASSFVCGDLGTIEARRIRLLLPSNAASAALCKCGGGVLALASGGPSHSRPSTSAGSGACD